MSSALAQQISTNHHYPGSNNTLEVNIDLGLRQVREWLVKVDEERLPYEAQKYLDMARKLLDPSPAKEENQSCDA